MSGSQPQPGTIKEGCSFYDRCEFAEDKCKINSPELEFVSELNTSVRCFNHKKLHKKKDEDTKSSKKVLRKLTKNDTKNGQKICDFSSFSRKAKTR